MGWSYVDENVTRGIRLPAPRRREPPFLTPEQFQNLLAGLPEKVRVMILLVMMTSMRVCEILAPGGAGSICGQARCGSRNDFIEAISPR